jgi:hypothetical protein
MFHFSPSYNIASLLYSFLSHDFIRLLTNLQYHVFVIQGVTTSFGDVHIRPLSFPILYTKPLSNNCVTVLDFELILMHVQHMAMRK